MPYTTSLSIAVKVMFWSSSFISAAASRLLRASTARSRSARSSSCNAALAGGVWADAPPVPRTTPMSTRTMEALRDTIDDIGISCPNLSSHDRDLRVGHESGRDLGRWCQVVPMHPVELRPVTQSTILLDDIREGVCGRETGERHVEPAPAREREARVQQRAEHRFIVILHGNMGQIALPERRADGRHSWRGGDRRQEIEKWPNGGKAGRIAAHYSLFGGALVPHRDTAFHAGSAPDDQDVVDAQPARREKTFEVGGAPHRRKIVAAIKALGQDGDRRKVVGRCALDTAGHRPGCGAQREGRKFAAGPVDRHAGKAGAKHALCDLVIGGDRREGRQVSRLREKRSHRLEAAPEHADPVPIGARDPESAEIWHAPDLATDKGVADRSLTNADGFPC